MLQSYKKYKRISSVKATVILLTVSALAVLVTWGVWSLWDFVADPIEHEESFDEIIEKAARRNNLPPELIRAVIWRESKFNRHTIGKDGEVGLMQIRPETAVIDWARAKKRSIPSKGALMDPALNIEIGSWYLGQAM
ncbi:MAG: transglycosylase SLT domain-containing protein [Lentisphaeria bacterium]|nr:transglycosylase SLT domain-containing protein [Lentisphaeria bacterium]